MNETEETGVAFRAGVKGLPFISTVGPQPDIDVQCDMAQGPNEQYFVVRLSDERIPGLSDPEAAYETGRALRWIGFELDKMKIPAAKGAGAFIPRLAEAVLYFKLRNEGVTTRVVRSCTESMNEAATSSCGDQAAYCAPSSAVWSGRKAPSGSGLAVQS